MLDKKRSYKGAIIGASISVIIFVFAGWVWFNHQYVTDQVSVWAFRPSDSITTIEERVDFTDKGKFYFYATQPRVASSDEFNTGCPRQETGSPILGCYDSTHIFIYDITNKKLDGMEEVTAAHEMLHAVWGRMSDSEQKRIGGLLRAEYKKHANDELTERMAYYERNEPGEFENELHSILGTEVSGLGADLENYYAQYFNNRSQLLALHDKYDGVFKTLKNRADVLYEELIKLGPSLQQRSKTYNKEVATLAADIKSFNSRANNNGFSSMSQFYAERSVLVARSNKLEEDRVSIGEGITDYNTKAIEYQSIASQIQELSDSIDSIKGLQEAPAVQ